MPLLTSPMFAFAFFGLSLQTQKERSSPGNAGDIMYVSCFTQNVTGRYCTLLLDVLLVVISQKKKNDPEKPKRAFGVVRGLRRPPRFHEKTHTVHDSGHTKSGLDTCKQSFGQSSFYPLLSLL